MAGEIGRYRLKHNTSEEVLRLKNMGTKTLSNVAADLRRLAYAVFAIAMLGTAIGWSHPDARSQAQVFPREEGSQSTMDIETLWLRLESLLDHNQLSGLQVGPAIRERNPLHSYVELARELANVPIRERVFLYEDLNGYKPPNERFVMLYDRDLQLAILNRLMYEVPESVPAGEYEAFLPYSYTSEKQYNLLLPLTETEGGALQFVADFKLSDYYRGGSGIGTLNSPGELRYFSETFPERDLSKYMLKQLHTVTLEEGIAILFMMADLPSGDNVLRVNDAIVPQSMQADPSRKADGSVSWDEQYVRVAKELQKYDDESILRLFQLFLDSHPRFAPPGSHLEEDRIGEAFRGIPETKLFLLNRLIYDAHSIDAPSPTYSIYTHFRFVQTGQESVEYMFPIVRNDDGEFSISKEFSGAHSVGLTRERPIEELKFFAKEFPRRRL